MKCRYGSKASLWALGIGLESDPFAKANAAAFIEALDRFGWKDGANLHIDWRWYGADAALARRQAIELLALRPDVVFAAGNPAVEAIQRQDKSIPMVFARLQQALAMRNGVQRSFCALWVKSDVFSAVTRCPLLHP